MTKENEKFIFEKMSFEELRRLKKKLETETSDQARDTLDGLYAYAGEKIKSYAEGAFDVTGIEAPFFLTFLDAFGKDAQGKLSGAAREAAIRLKPELEAFDAENGYTGLKNLSENRLIENINALEKFEHLDPFTPESGRLKYPEFNKTAQLLNAIRITGNNNAFLDENEQKQFRATMTDTARIETYLRLLAKEEEITEQDYLQNFREILEINLVNLLITDKVVKEYPLSEKNKKKLYESFEKLVASFS